MKLLTIKDLAEYDPGPVWLADAIDHQPEDAKPGRILPVDMEPMLGMGELAAFLSCSRRLVERMRSAGKVPKPDMHVGRCPRWTPATIRTWIKSGGKP